MNLSRAPGQYSQQDQDRLRTDLEAADLENFKKGRDIEVSGGRVILTSTGGIRWALVVSDAGALTTVAP